MAATCRRTSVALLLAVISVTRAGVQPLEVRAVPDLIIEAPPQLAGARARVQSFDRERLRGVMRLVGLGDPGLPIRVVLAPEDSDLARRTPDSIAGFAVGADSLVVLFPSRSATYPDDTLEDVLHHEVAHVLIWRAAGGRPLPRWFHEGLATTAERTWDMEDQVRVLRERAFARRTSLDRVDELFGADASSRRRAYALAGSFVRELIGEHGPSAPGAIIARVADGQPFPPAFAEVTGLSLADAEAAFLPQRPFWARWGPYFMTSSGLWIIITLIALLAIVRRRQKSAALRKRWTDEGLD